MKTFSIGEASSSTGRSVETLRYYERAGLLRSIPRQSNGHRAYEEIDLAWIDFIGCIRSGGMPIREIKEYVDLCDQPRSEDHRKAILEQHLARLDNRITELQEQRSRISEKIGWYQEEIAQLAVSR